MSDALRALALDVLERNRDLTIATLREDGWPQATVVSFVHDGLTVYFAVGEHSQKRRNIARDGRVSITCGAVVEDWMTIKGISLAGRARIVADPAETARIGELMMRRFGPQIAALTAKGQMPPDTGSVFIRVDPVVVSVLDYTRGFGHTDLLTLPGAA